MRLIDLITEPQLPDNIVVTGITADSRQVKSGNVFVAIKGTTLDGHDFIDDAIKGGAVAVVAEKLHDNDTIPTIVRDNPRLELSMMAARIAGRQPGEIVAITGTNGKTSVADFLRQIWNHIGWRSASIGTLGIRGDGSNEVAELSHLTTPDPVNLHKNLNLLADLGVTNIALEASSHGIEQDRLSGLKLVAAGFTNLSRDHLDHHSTMQNYFKAKTKLFTDLLPDGATAVINLDDKYGQQLAGKLSDRQIYILGVGKNENANLRLENIDHFDGGISMTTSHNGVETTIPLAMTGEFQAENALIAAGLAFASGVAMQHALLALPYVKPAPGRMQPVGGHPRGAGIIIDYAHTPDALKTALLSLRQECRGKLGVVFGCGGDRDRGKRSEMGKIADKHADFTIVTDDNPRHEDPAAIRADIMAKCNNAIEIGDRQKAIHEAILKLEKDDVLLIAGKGHENNQLVGSETLPFSDDAVAAAVLTHMGGDAA
jgi:UDP-N-acetylmuramoyl-L-alanyl-D-glutamate--2,6-diaminopimelate ligase